MGGSRLKQRPSPRTLFSGRVYGTRIAALKRAIGFNTLKRKHDASIACGGATVRGMLTMAFTVKWMRAERRFTLGGQC